MPGLFDLRQIKEEMDSRQAENVFFPNQAGRVVGNKIIYIKLNERKYA